SRRSGTHVGLSDRPGAWGRKGPGSSRGATTRNGCSALYSNLLASENRTRIPERSRLPSGIWIWVSIQGRPLSRSIFGRVLRWAQLGHPLRL
ncbi:MAG: hypothetical protein RMK32_08855, partial [Anaerolineae bacterium]|nr:hypothetical protein [Anaerolineae bacterium]